MKKKLIIGGLVLAFIFISYSVVWVKSYNHSKEYYSMAMENYNKGDYIIALKGDRVLKEDQSGYIYLGGFQQAMEIWDSKYAFPKPDIAERSKQMAERILSEIDIKTGQQIFKTYFKIDNRFLPEVLIRIGELQMEENQLSKAQETFKMAGEAFARREGITEIVQQKLEEIEKLQ